MPLKYFAVGTGRCGTKYTAELLKSAGYLTTHDCGEQDPATWQAYDAVSTWRAPLLCTPYVSGAQVVHLVRDPLYVIRSGVYQAFAPHNESWKRQYVGLPPDPLEAWVQYYVRWNEFIEELAPDAVFHRIEDGPNLLDKIGAVPRYGFDDPKCHQHVKQTFSLGWDQMPEGVWLDRLVAMAERYGYNTTGRIGGAKVKIAA